MRKSLSPFFSLLRAGHTAAVAVRLRHSGTREDYLHWLMLGAWWLILTLGLFFPLRILYLFLGAGMGVLLWHQQKHRSCQALEERDTVSRLLVAQRALLTLDLDALLRRLVDEAVQLIPCRGAGLILLNRRQDGVERTVTSGRFSAPSAGELRGALTKGVLHEALAQGAVVLNTPQAIHARLHSLQMKECAQQNLLIVGMRRQQHVGFFMLADKHGGEGFRDDEVHMLTTLAEQAVVAIENAREFAQARDAEAERRGLLHAVISAQEQERKRMVDEWHDHFGAKLFELLQSFRSCHKLIVQRVPESKERFEQFAAELDALAALVRGLANELRPAVLDDFGFVAALREYVAELRAQEPFHVTVRAEEVDQQLPSEANLTLFRITQEALLNIRKHAQASHVQIAFLKEHTGVSLMIKDDGQGFNTEQPPQGHYGLLYMRERAEACGGTFRVVSARGQGTEVRVDFPGGGRAAVNLSRREHTL